MRGRKTIRVHLCESVVKKEGSKTPGKALDSTRPFGYEGSYIKAELVNPIYAAGIPRITSNPKPSGWGASPYLFRRKMKPRCQHCNTPLSIWTRFRHLSYNAKKPNIPCKKCGKESGYSYRPIFGFTQFICLGLVLLFALMNQMPALLAIGFLFTSNILLPIFFLKKPKDGLEQVGAGQPDNPPVKL